MATIGEIAKDGRKNKQSLNRLIKDTNPFSDLKKKNSKFYIL